MLSGNKPILWYKDFCQCNEFNTGSFSCKYEIARISEHLMILSIVAIKMSLYCCTICRSVLKTEWDPNIFSQVTEHNVGDLNALT